MRPGGVADHDVEQDDHLQALLDAVLYAVRQIVSEETERRTEQQPPPSLAEVISRIREADARVRQDMFGSTDDSWE